MEIASGSMILHPDLASELRTLHESSGFDSAGAFLKHLFALEDQHRSQQCLTTLFTNVEQPWLGNYNAGQAVSLDSAPKTVSVGIQVKLCFCSDNIIESAFREQGVTSDLNSVQQDDLREELSDSDSDYDDTEEVFEEADDYNSRNNKQRNETVTGKQVNKTVGRPTRNRRKPNQGAHPGYSCEECGDKFTRECYLIHHMKKHRGEETTVQCQFCDLTYPSPWTLTIHISLMHPEHAPPPRDKPPKNPIICTTCGMALKTAYTYRKHQRTHTDERPYECDLCHKTFKFSGSLAKHKLGMHTQERPYPCHLCDNNFKHSSDLIRHQVVHTGEKRYKCLQCNKAYTAINSLQFHNLRYHENPGVKPFNCPHCNKCFAKKFSMNDHIRRKHLYPEKYKRRPGQPRKPPPERTFHCEICSKAFRYASNLRRHYISHTGEQPFKCTQCDKAYRDNDTLKIHILRYHENPGVKPYECPHCDKCFAKRSSLPSHIKKKHENPEQNKPEKSKTKPAKPKLAKPRNPVPPEERAFQCDLCGKAFGFMSNLRRHYVTHTGEQPFQCTQCDKAYRDNNSLKRHIRRFHENPEIKPDECPHCDKCFANKSALLSHIEKQHENPEQDDGQNTEKVPSKYVHTLKIPAHVGMTSVVSQGFKSTAAIKRAPLVLPAMLQKSPNTEAGISTVTMEVISGSMILHPILASELKALQESGCFKTPGSFLKHLFGLEEQHRSQQCVTTLYTDVQQPRLGDANQDVILDSARQSRTVSIGVQVKLCFCSDNIIDSAFHELNVNSEVDSYQQDDLQEEISDSDSDYNDTEDVLEEEVVITSRNSRKRKKTVAKEQVHKTVGRPAKNQRKPNQVADQEFSCEECGAKFSQECYLVHHMKQHSREESLQCKYCDHTYLIPAKLAQHISVMHPKHAPPPREKHQKQSFICATCGTAFKTMHTYQRHLATHVDERPYECNLCKEKFKYLTSLGNHKLQVHNIERPYSCHLCSRSFKMPSHLKDHRVVHTGEKRYKCLECNKAFTAYNSLRLHKLRHENPGVKPHECPHCQKRFAGKHTLDIHIERKHVNPEQYKRKPFQLHDPPLERSFQCHICGSAFTYLSNLRSHTTKHTGRKRFKCTQCDKEYIANHTLKNHVIRVHENPGFKPVKCPLCDVRFSQKSSLPKHIARMHENPQREKYKRNPNRPRKPPPERSFQCDLCDKAFRYLCNLKRHGLIHTGEVPFQCTQCDKVYRDNATLKTHILVCHDNPGVKQFRCPQCDKWFAYKTSLNKHIKTQHENPERGLEIPAHVGMTSVVSQGFKNTAVGIKRTPLVLPATP
ncbi:zinc finger protein 729-like [Patiria miniata]|uniref:C2H2-type domain-containing protein n=1 Tax=Patiria miniata TaxID=46514 RepID=A0A914B7X0_PATMI|nr:zinc finger protein 729-like [Patiria miniata]